jgi:pimeloyl-ACP methyl ester carboxylesterase
VLSHGWPLSADAFEDQMLFLAARGYRCIAHDRRGHGRVIPGAPHGMCSTLKDQINAELLAFCQQSSEATA